MNNEGRAERRSRTRTKSATNSVVNLFSADLEDALVACSTVACKTLLDSSCRPMAELLINDHIVGSRDI